MEVQWYSTSSALSKIIFQLYVRHIMCAYIFKGWLQYSLTISGTVLHIPESGIKSCSEGGSLYLHCWTRNQGNIIDYVVTHVTVKIIQSCISLAVFAKFHFKGGAHTCLVAASDIRASRACMWAPPLTKICDKWHETVIYIVTQWVLGYLGTQCIVYGTFSLYILVGFVLQYWGLYHFMFSGTKRQSSSLH